jgi:hypothetical protein
MSLGLLSLPTLSYASAKSKIDQANGYFRNKQLDKAESLCNEALKEATSLQQWSYAGQAHDLLDKIDEYKKLHPSKASKSKTNSVANSFSYADSTGQVHAKDVIADARTIVDSIGIKSTSNDSFAWLPYGTKSLCIVSQGHYEDFGPGMPAQIRILQFDVKIPGDVVPFTMSNIPKYANLVYKTQFSCDLTRGDVRVENGQWQAVVRRAALSHP